MFILYNWGDQPELLHDQVISWTKKNVLGPHELWHSEWTEHSWYHTPWCTGCKATSYPSEFPRAFESCTYRQKLFHIDCMTTSPEHPKIEASQSCPPGFDSGLEMREIVSWFIDNDLIGM